MIGGRVATVIADILVIVVTWTKAGALRAEAARLGVKVPFSTTMMRDGEHFCANFLSIRGDLILY